MFDQKTRGYIYRVSVAVMPLLILYGVVSETEAALWVGVVAAILSVGKDAMASHNTPVADPDI